MPSAAGVLREWREHAAELEVTDDGLPLVEFDDEAWTPDMKAIATHRKATLEAAQAIRDRIRRELAGEA